MYSYCIATVDYLFQTICNILLTSNVSDIEMSLLFHQECIPFFPRNPKDVKKMHVCYTQVQTDIDCLDHTIVEVVSRLSMTFCIDKAKKQFSYIHACSGPDS